jgi:hypothetical protein
VYRNGFQFSPPKVAATVGLLALASAMRIGRFAFTPILPLMQHDAGLTIAQGGWLATGNYLGYLAGALICMAFVPRPVQSVRFGLICVATFTVAMGLSDSLSLWLAFRFAAGLASAFVLVGVSAWAMPILARYDKGLWSGRIFAGVGVGIALAGLLGLAASVHAWGSRSTWVAVGVVAAALAALLWSPLAIEDGMPIEAAERGADVIIAQGGEAGGYGGVVSTRALVPQVVDAVSPIPVVAAGGIFDGRGIAAALMLGTGGYGTVLRSLRTPFMDEWGAKREEARRECGRLWPEFHPRIRAGRRETLLTAGQTSGGIKEILPVAEIIRQLTAEAVVTFVKVGVTQRERNDRN